MLLIYLTIAWVGGLLLAHALWGFGALGCSTPAWPWIGSAAAVVAVGCAVRRRPVWRLVILLCFFLILGAWRYQAQPLAACPTPARLAFYNGDETGTVEATVEGVVIRYPDVRDTRIYYRLRAERVTIAGRSHIVHGDLLVQGSRIPEYRYGDRLRVTGNLQTPPVLDDFDYRIYLARQGIHSLMWRARLEKVGAGQGSLFWRLLSEVKARGAALLNRVLPEPAAALANGMLLGIESGISEEVNEAFRATGTSHVIVISGSNIVLLSSVLMAGLSRFLGKRRAAIPVAAGIAVYVLLTGADPAALRAGLMGILYVFAIYLGRQSTAYVSLCASALLMTAWNPLALWDIGFQLSFGATLGLILFARPIEMRVQRVLARWLTAEQMRQAFAFLRDALIVTLAAQVLTLPLIVYYFGRVSVISLVTNLLILPAQPPIMAGGMATLIGGLLWEPLGRVLAVIPWLFLTYTTAVVRLAAAVPWASVATGGFGQLAALLYLAILAGAMLWRVAYQRGWTAIPARRALAWVGAIAAPLWLGVTLLQALPDGRLHLFFVPGEGGEAALVVTPDGGRAWFWDGRGDGEALADAVQPFVGRRLDVAIGPPGATRWPAASAIDPAQLDFNAIVQLAADVTLTRLPTDVQPVLALRYGRFRTILPAALLVGAQADLVARGADLPVTLLKAPGPDTGAWPTTEYLAATASQVIFWPQGTTYPPDVAALLATRSALQVTPDAILEVITDGERLWLQQRTGDSRR